VTPFGTTAAARRRTAGRSLGGLPRMIDLCLVLISSSTMLLFVAFAFAAWML